MVTYSGVKNLRASSILLIIASMVVTFIIKAISAEVLLAIVLGGVGLIAFFVVFIVHNVAYRKLGVKFNAFIGFFIALSTMLTFVFIALTFFGIDSCGETEEGTAYIVCDPFLRYSSYAIYLFLGLTAFADLICAFKFHHATDEFKYFILFFIKFAILLIGAGITFYVQKTGSYDSRCSFLKYILLINIPIAIMDLVTCGFLRSDYNNGVGEIEDEDYNYNGNPAKPLFVIQVILGVSTLLLIFAIEAIVGVSLISSSIYIPAILIGVILWNILCAHKAIKSRLLAIITLIGSIFSFQILGIIGSIIALVNHHNYDD